MSTSPLEMPNSAPAQDNTFATPSAFLHDLKDYYDLIPKSDSAGLSKSDLDKAAHSSSDVKERAVASVAEKYFGELQILAQSEDGTGKSILTKKDVDAAVKLEDGNVEGYKKDLSVKQTQVTLETAAEVFAALTGAALTVEAPVLTAGFIAGAGLTAYVQAGIYADLSDKETKAGESSERIKAVMGGWGEVNGGR